MGSVYIHGTNGSGKTTLARALITCASAGRDTQVGKYNGADFVRCGDVGFIGRYSGATGGLDTVHPFQTGIDAALMLSSGYDLKLVMESMVTPGLDTCLRLHDNIPLLHFFWLDTPVEQCIRQTMQRREARRKAGVNVAEFNPANLIRKAESVASWHRRLTEARLLVERGDWWYVYNRCKTILGVDAPHSDQLLE